MTRGANPSGFVEPCLPSPAERPPSGPGWVHEIKHDGFRLLGSASARATVPGARPTGQDEEPGGAGGEARGGRRLGEGEVAVTRLLTTWSLDFNVRLRINAVLLLQLQSVPFGNRLQIERNRRNGGATRSELNRLLSAGKPNALPSAIAALLPSGLADNRLGLLA